MPVALCLCHVPHGIAALPSVRWPARQSQLQMSSLVAAFHAQASHQKDHPFIGATPLHTNHSTFPTRSVKAEKKDESKVSTIFYLCFSEFPLKMYHRIKPSWYKPYIWFHFMFCISSQKVHKFAQPVVQWAVCQVSVMRPVKERLSQFTGLSNVLLFQIWHKSLKRNYKEAFFPVRITNL